MPPLVQRLCYILNDQGTYDRRPWFKSLPMWARRVVWTLLA
jgi:hypothetical protein